MEKIQATEKLNRVRLYDSGPGIYIEVHTSSEIEETNSYLSDFLEMNDSTTFTVQRHTDENGNVTIDLDFHKE